MARDLDIVLWGATGYTGQLVAEYLATAPSAKGLRWAIAGRDPGKLDAVHASLPVKPEVLIADAGDPASLDAIAARTKVVCTTVGPYAKYGSFLVAACVRAGTSYCDLTGETPWIRRMIDEHHETAQVSGVRIVHCCGFDSIPSDLGVWMLHQAMKERGAQLGRVDSFFSLSGGFSGATLASLLGVIDAAAKDREVRKVLGDPYSLDPRPRVGGPDGSDPKGVRYEPRLKRWTAPFVMSAINTRVVRRSNAILDYPYGREFRYTEQMGLAGGLKGLVTATGITATLGGFVAASQVPVLRKRLDARLPKPGEGPSPEQRERGHFKVKLLAEGVGGAPKLIGTVADQRDPGYSSTKVMLAESALCLARDPLTSGGGVLTPAAAMGDALIARLRAAGFTFSVEEQV